MQQREPKPNCRLCEGTGWQPVLEPIGAFLKEIPGVKAPCSCPPEAQPRDIEEAIERLCYMCDGEVYPSRMKSFDGWPLCSKGCLSDYLAQGAD
jgi:hypothetical protein